MGSSVNRERVAVSRPSPRPHFQLSREHGTFLTHKVLLVRCTGRPQTVGCISGERFPFVLGGFGDASYFGVLMAAYSAASNWRRNPTISKKNPHAVNGKAR